MLNDEILEEVRANREAYAAKFNYNLRAIYENLKKSETERLKTGYAFVEPSIKYKALRAVLTALPNSQL